MNSGTSILIVATGLLLYGVPVALIVIAVIWARKIMSLLTEIRDSLKKE